MATPAGTSLSVPAFTERQALVRLNSIFQSLLESVGSDGTVTLEQALAVLAAGVVQGGASNYQTGQLGAMTITPQGSVRVQVQEPMVQFTPASPWGGDSPW